MKLIDFLDKNLQHIFSVIFFVDFSITSWIWIAFSPILSEYEKVNYISMMILFCLMPWILQLAIKVIQWEREEFGTKSYPKVTKEKKEKFTKLFEFFYTILVFSLTRVMDFMEFNEQSYFALRLVFMIALNIFIVIWIHIVVIKYKKIIIIITLIILNSIFILSFTWVKISIDIEPLDFPQTIILVLISGVVAAVCCAISNNIRSKRKKKREKFKLKVSNEK